MDNNLDIAREGFARCKYAIRQRIKKYKHLQEVAQEVQDHDYYRSCGDAIVTCQRILDDIIGIEVACTINFMNWDQNQGEGK